jgi:hypothetical protein
MTPPPFSALTSSSSRTMEKTLSFQPRMIVWSRSTTCDSPFFRNFILLSTVSTTTATTTAR